MQEEYEYAEMSQELPEHPPEFSIGLLLSAFSQRGVFNTMNDEALGPHAHLFVLLCIVFLLASLIGVIAFII